MTALSLACWLFLTRPVKAEQPPVGPILSHLALLKNWTPRAVSWCFGTTLQFTSLPLTFPNLHICPRKHQPQPGLGVCLPIDDSSHLSLTRPCLLLLSIPRVAVLGTSPSHPSAPPSQLPPFLPPLVLPDSRVTTCWGSEVTRLCPGAVITLLISGRANPHCRCRAVF